MEINADNITWAVKKFRRFRNWQGFPQDEEGSNALCRSFLRIVWNLTTREVIEQGCKRSGAQFNPEQIDWAAKPFGPEENDADWLLDLIYDTMDSFPLPVAMREIYRKWLPPSVEIKAYD